MKANKAPSIADILFIVIAPLTAITRTIKLTHSDGDLAAHIRMGQVILERGEIPSRSLASITAANDPLVAHAWLSEVIFSSLFSLGGLALISVVAGIVIAATHAAVALFLRQRGADARWALSAALISLAVSSTHWLARPHMFSILGVAVTLFILESGGRWRLTRFALLFLVWTNLHGGWLFGLLMIAIYIAGAATEAFLTEVRRAHWVRQAKADALAFVVAAGATLANPFGIELHREVFRSATNSALATQMGEFLPPDFQSLAPLPFLLCLLATFVLLTIATRRMTAPHLLLVVVSAFLGLRSFRHMALFGVAAWPLVALHTAKYWPAHRRSFRWFGEIARLDRSARVGLYSAPVAIVLLVLGLNRGMAGEIRLIREDFSSERFPVAALRHAKAANLQGPIFESWEWGGYIMYAWPEARLLVDPLKFNDSTVAAYAIIEGVRPGWKEVMARWEIRAVLVSPRSALAHTLENDSSWNLWYRDSTASVFRPAN